MRKSSGFAAAQEQQPFGFQFRRPVQQSVFESLAGHFASGDHVRGRVFNGCVRGFNRDLRLVFFRTIFFATVLFRFVEHDCYQAFSFHFGGIGEGKISFHDCVVPVSSAGRELGKRQPTPLRPDSRIIPLWSHPEGRQSRRISRAPATRSVDKFCCLHTPDPSHAQDDASNR